MENVASQYGGHAHHKLNFVMGNFEGEAYSCSAGDENNKSGRSRYRCEKASCKFWVDFRCVKIDFYGLSDSSITRVTPIRNRFMSNPSFSWKFIYINIQARKSPVRKTIPRNLDAICRWKPAKVELGNPKLAPRLKNLDTCLVKWIFAWEFASVYLCRNKRYQDSGYYTCPKKNL